jgi:hypothetical protein
MAKDKLLFAVDRAWIMTGSHVTETDMTGSDISHVSCLEVCSVDAQPEVAQYPPYWGLRTGSNFSHVTDGKRPCPEVCSAHVQFSPGVCFLCSSTVVQ